MLSRSESELIAAYPVIYATASNYVYWCHAGDKWELGRICYSFAEVFDSGKDLSTEGGKLLFRQTLRPLLTVEGNGRKAMMTLYPEYYLETPETLLPVEYALRHPSCPPDLLSLAARHSWWFFRAHAIRNPACRDEDRVYAALMGTEIR